MLLGKNILFISHHSEVELGIMEEFFINEKYSIKIAKPFDNFKLPLNFNNYSGVIILGGAMNVEDDEKYPWIKEELYWLKNLITLNIPTIGICLGAQLIAKALGGDVGYHDKNYIEVGYRNISQLKKNSVIGNFPEKVYHWHTQGIKLPNIAKHLAYNSIFNAQAFSIKDNIFGFQFHPEVNKKMILNWNLKSRHMLSKPGATAKNIQLKDHEKYSNSVKSWFENSLKNWLNLNY